MIVDEASKLMVIRFDSGKSRGKKNVIARSICGNVDSYNAIIEAQQR